MVQQFYIPILLGTGRKNRQSEKVARYIAEQAEHETLFSTDIIDVRDYATDITQPSWEKPTPEKVGQLAEKMATIDGLIIVTPEYSHGYPGELKIFLDKLDKELNYKPIGLCGVSSGGFGGCRVIELLVPVLTAFKAIPVIPAVYFSKVEELFDDKGNIQNDSYDKNVGKMFQAVVQTARKIST